MSDYTSYRFMGFWFQPDPVPMEEARPFSNNGYLKKYWNEDIYSQKPENSAPNIFENYFNFSYGSSVSGNSSCYDEIIGNFKNTVNGTNNQNTNDVKQEENTQQKSSCIELSVDNSASFDIDFNSYFDAYFS